MKRRMFALALACALALSLTACGGGNGGGTSSSAPGGSSTGGSSTSQTDGSGSDASNPDGSQPDGSGDVSAPEEVTLTLNKTDIKLTKAGATFQLRYTTDPEVVDGVIYNSSNAKAATIDEKGVITAVAPGTSTITVECGGATATATVTCEWKESQPAPAPDASKPSNGTSSSGTPGSSSSGSSSSGGSSSADGSSSSAPAGNVDLASFYSAITGKYEFGYLELADSAILDMLYTGITGVSTEQCLVYVCALTMNNGEFGLVQVSDSKDVDAVKAAFQARIDYMVGDGNGPGGAQYPMAMDQWENNSRIVSSGNYVMMVVHESCDEIVKEFNALF